MEKIKEPTQEQIKEFWVKLGLYCEKRQGYEAWFTTPSKEIFICDNNPPFDLNNLFKYAVPKMQENGFELRFYGGLVGSDFHAMFRTPASTLIGVMQDKDPALALFWAIWEAMHHAS